MPSERSGGGSFLASSRPGVAVSSSVSLSRESIAPLASVVTCRVSQPKLPSSRKDTSHIGFRAHLADLILP